MVLDEMKTEACNLLRGPKSNIFFFPVVYFRVVPSGFVFCAWAEQHSSPQVFFKRMTNAMPNYGAQQGAERGLSDRCTGSQREVNQCLSKNGMVPANERSKYRQKIEK